MVTQLLFSALIALLIIQRLFELRLSKKNEKKIREKGGKEFDAGHYPWMVFLHSSWFVCMLVEVWLLPTPFVWWVCIVSLVFSFLGQFFRYLAIRTLGWRWSTRIMIVPNTPLVTTGIYQYIRHPNYLGVILEIAFVPLIHGAWRTALLFSFANGILLWIRIKAEEKALYPS